MASSAHPRPAAIRSRAQTRPFAGGARSTSARRAGPAAARCDGAELASTVSPRCRSRSLSKDPSTTSARSDNDSTADAHLAGPWARDAEEGVGGRPGCPHFDLPCCAGAREFRRHVDCVSPPAKRCRLWGWMRSRFGNRRVEDATLGVRSGLHDVTHCVGCTAARERSLGSSGHRALNRDLNGSRERRAG